MFRWGEEDHYYRVGQSALDCISECKHFAEHAEPSRILDFGCGYGRVLRVICKEFPAARVTACDVDREAAEFCARTFGAVCAYSSVEPSQVRFEERFDLVWVGSVFTHIDTSAWEGMLRALALPATTAAVSRSSR